MAILTDDEVRAALADRRAWRRVGDALVRERACRDFSDALGLLERLGDAAEDYGRHPEMAIAEGNRVRVRVANPNGAGFTDAELRLVAKVDEAIAEVAAQEAQPPPEPPPERGPLAAVAAVAVAAPAPVPEASPPSPSPSPSPDPRDPEDQHAPQDPPWGGTGRGRMPVAIMGGAVVGAAVALASRAALRR
jgi:pterin-4a-carbinolamine dehydratase